MPSDSTLTIRVGTALPRPLALRRSPQCLEQLLASARWILFLARSLGSTRILVLAVPLVLGLSVVVGQRLLRYVRFAIVQCRAAAAGFARRSAQLLQKLGTRGAGPFSAAAVTASGIHFGWTTDFRK